MKIKTSSLFLTSALIITLLCGLRCKKDVDKPSQLPPVTQEGKNTVGFTIDGEVWVPYYKCRYFGNPCGEASARYGESGGAAPNSIAFQFVRERKDKSSSSLTISAAYATITSAGEKIDSISSIFRGENWTGNTDTYTGIKTGSSFIITKFDRQSQIISGTFELILNEDNRSGKTIALKNGRFDFKFNYCKCSD